MDDIKKLTEEQLKKLSQTEIKEYAAQLITQKELAKQRSKINTQKKKENGIRQLAVDIPEQILNKFRTLMERTKNNKTALLTDMVLTYEQLLNQQENQQSNQHNDQHNNQHHNQQYSSSQQLNNQPNNRR
ncbi:MAG: hypothetical protein HYR87_07340 [Thaumarchaeota archaeon]|nr:hypothetical protein [Nitrososphaerota archaeon]